jgi:hypothetical protein
LALLFEAQGILDVYRLIVSDKARLEDASESAAARALMEEVLQ